MPWVDPVSVSSSRPVEAFHSLAVLSAPVVARSFPSRLKATSVTHPSWPTRERTWSPVATSHTLDVPSKLDVARRVPSGLKSTPKAADPSPGILRSFVNEGTLQNVTARPQPLEASSVPSGLKSRSLPPMFRSRILFPDVASHTVEWGSESEQAPVAMRPPSGLTATPPMPLAPWASRTWRTLPDAVSHTAGAPRTLFGVVTRNDPSGPKAALQ